MQNVCGVSCGFRFRPTLGLTLRLKQKMNFSESYGKRGRRSPPRERKQTKKIMAFRKRIDCCGPHALEVTSLNAVASNLLSTYL